MELSPEGNCGQPEGKIHGMLVPVEVGNTMVRRRPHVPHLVCCPNRATTGACPEDIVEKLVAKQKIAVAHAQPSRVILPLCPLELEGVKHQMPAASQQPELREIPKTHLDRKSTR